MIIKTLRPHAHAARLGSYLTKDSKENERIEDRGTRGTVATDTVGALQEMAASRRGARCQQPLYHVVFNAAKGEHLTAEQWDRALAMWEQEMGLADRQRAVIQHQKDGRWHTHVVYNRIDPATGKAVNIGRDHFKAKKIAREIERELGLQKVTDKRPLRRREQQPPLKWETEQTRRTKSDANAIREQIAEAWARSDNGRAFQQALAAEDLTLAKGDKRPYVIVDQDGNVFALSGRVLPHTRMKDIRAKLADIDHDQLATVETTRTESRKVDRKKKRAKPKDEDNAESLDAARAPSAASEQRAPELHDRHRQKHLELNRQAQAKEEAHAKSAQELARAHERERQQLTEKQRDRWWHKLLWKSRRTRAKEADARERQEQQQAAERAALEAQKEKELAAIEAQRAALRSEEKRERALRRQFNQQAKETPAKPSTTMEKTHTNGRTPEQQAIYDRELAAARERTRERERQRHLERQRGRELGDD